MSSEIIEENGAAAAETPQKTVPEFRRAAFRVGLFILILFVMR